MRGTNPFPAYTAQAPTCFSQVTADLALIAYNLRAQPPMTSNTGYNEQKPNSTTFNTFSSLSQDT